MVRYGYNLKRRKRAGATMMKETITNIDKSVAKIPTLTGVSSSVENKMIIRDMLFFVKNYIISALRLCGKIFLKRTPFVGKIITWSCEEDFRKLNIVKESFEFAKENDILDESLKYKDISYDLLGKVLCIYLINLETMKPIEY